MASRMACICRSAISLRYRFGDVSSHLLPQLVGHRQLPALLAGEGGEARRLRRCVFLPGRLGEVLGGTPVVAAARPHEVEKPGLEREAAGARVGAQALLHQPLGGREVGSLLGERERTEFIGRQKIRGQRGEDVEHVLHTLEPVVGEAVLAVVLDGAQPRQVPGGLSETQRGRPQVLARGVVRQLLERPWRRQGVRRVARERHRGCAQHQREPPGRGRTPVRRAPCDRAHLKSFDAFALI